MSLDFKRYVVWDAKLYCDRCEGAVAVPEEEGGEISVWQAINDSVKHERTVHGEPG